MKFPALLFILLIPLLSSVAGQQCSTSFECKTPDAPHCSRWGWCQWSAQYGDAGPSQWESDDAPPGSCRSAQDCTPRAPVCSNQGFCTVRQTLRQKPEAPRSSGSSTRSQTVSSQGPRGQTIIQPRNNHQTHQTSRVSSASSNRASRTHQQFLKSQANHLDASFERISATNNFKRSSGHGSQNHNNNIRIKQKPSRRILEPLPAVPDQTTKSSRNLPQSFETLMAVPVPVIQRRVTKTTSTTTSVPPPDYFDRMSTDYYDQYDYNYYTEFEVMKKKEPSELISPTREQSKSLQRTSSSRSQGQARLAPKASPPVSVSQGCLNDCVTDCVAIQQLTAYRDCVEFCGRTCNNK